MAEVTAGVAAGTSGEATAGTSGDPTAGTKDADVGGHQDASFDRYARMVRRALDVPVALVSLVEETRQVFVGAEGLLEPYATSRETPLSHSFCQYVVQDARPLVISDARLDERLHDNLAIRDLGVIAYAGFPLRDASGRTVGSLCAIDPEPRLWTQPELNALEDLAEACTAELVQRDLRTAAVARAHEAAATSMRSRLLLALSERLATTRTLAEVSVAVEKVAHEELGCLQAGMWLRQVTDPLHVSRAAPAAEGRPAETLTFVHNPVTDWAQATAHTTLAVGEDNPLGSALLRDGLLVFADRDAQNRAYPHLETAVQTGEARAYMPLVAAGHAYGALALVWPEAREFDDEDRVTIGSLMSYTAQAVQRALLLQERVDVAVTLQNAMLTRLPQPDHLELVARYRPAAAREQVGGDWYDAVVMPDGATTVMVGDVVGHDIDAAAVMGQLRAMLRAFAWTHAEPPARNVERLDRAALDLELEAMATLVVARIEQTDEDAARGLRTLRWTTAGHPPPMLLHPDGTVVLLGEDSEIDPMLGAAPERDRHDQTAVLPAGSTLLLYTDGLVERRGENLDRGLERARAAVARHGDRSAPELLDSILDELVGDAPGDDVALLAVRFHPEHG
jgi:serine phosphatase RsbU (regulator of sigma subunit)